MAGVCFILSLKWLSRPTIGAAGNSVGEIGMAAAIIGALLQHGVISYEWIIVGFVLGGADRGAAGDLDAHDGRAAADGVFPRVRCAGRGAGGHGPLFLSVRRADSGIDHTTMAILCVEVLLGSLTFTGSLMAFGKLQEILPQRPITFKGQNYFNFLILGLAVACGVVLTINPAMWYLFPVLLGLAMIFGVLLIVPIGGADMPTVIAC